MRYLNYSYSIILFLLIFCSPAMLYAQDLGEESNSDTVTLSLKECMRYAIENSVDVTIAKANSNDERISRREAILRAFTPSVDAGSYGYLNYGRAVDPETNTYTSTTSFNNGYSLSGSFTLFNGFEAINNLKITSTAIKMGLSREQQTIDNLCLAVMEAYYNVLYYKELAAIVKKQVETAKSSLSKAQKEEGLGVKSYAEVVQIEADLADKEYMAITAANNYSNALITLKDLMFWPVGTPLEVENSLISATDNINGCSFLADTSDIIDIAHNTSPAIAIARGELTNAKLQLNTARWQSLPSLTLSGGWSTSYFTYPGREGYTATPFWTQFRDNGGEYVQISLHIPIFNRLARRSNINRKKNAYMRADAAYRQKVREVDAEVARAVQDCNGAGMAYLQAERRAAVQEEAYELNNKMFEQGLISPIEFRTASESYLEAKAERLNAILKYRLKESVVKYYRGVPYIEQ